MQLCKYVEENVLANSWSRDVGSENASGINFLSRMKQVLAQKPKQVPQKMVVVLLIYGCYLGLGSQKMG